VNTTPQWIMCSKDASVDASVTGGSTPTGVLLPGIKLEKQCHSSNATVWSDSVQQFSDEAWPAVQTT
jgi:hypothetical protein